MKLALKILMMLIIVGGLTTYVLYLSTGTLPNQVDLPDIKMPDISLKKYSSKAQEIKQEVQTVLSNKNNTGESQGSTEIQIVYKWVDDQGLTRYSSEAPPEGTQSSTLELDPNTNIVQSDFQQDKNEESKRNETNESGDGTLVIPSHQLIEDAKKVQQQLNERAEKQREIIDSL